VLGVLPFLVGDAVKIVVAMGLLPAAWKLSGRRGRD
jgi:biotin transport system substrate-specific component